ncbi:MAG: CarD family transcriptional regulator [Pseudomonadota bacterium]
MPTKKPVAKPAKKPAPAKEKAKPAAKAAPVKKPAPSKTAAKPAKPAAKPAPKPAAKEKPKAAPKAAATKPAAKAAPKAPLKPAEKPAAKGKAAASKEVPQKVAPKKKLNVGQKPRSDKPDLPLKPQSFAPPSRDGDMSAASTPKPTPASKEAKQTFKVNDSVVYPAHGVGRIVGIEKQVIAGITNELFVLDFEQEKLKLKVPTAKAISSGMRALSDDAQVKKAVDLLKGRARIKRTMWSRRAQEYEAKINSGDILAVAEVVRDLYRATDQPEQSYSERQLFEAALDRLAREVAAVRKSDLAKALGELDASLQQKKAA